MAILIFAENANATLLSVGTGVLLEWATQSQMRSCKILGMSMVDYDA